MRLCKCRRPTSVCRSMRKLASCISNVERLEHLSPQTSHLAETQLSCHDQHGQWFTWLTAHACSWWRASVNPAKKALWDCPGCEPVDCQSCQSHPLVGWAWQHQPEDYPQWGCEQWGFEQNAPDHQVQTWPIRLLAQILAEQEVAWQVEEIGDELLPRLDRRKGLEFYIFRAFLALQGVRHECAVSERVDKDFRSICQGGDLGGSVGVLKEPRMWTVRSVDPMAIFSWLISPRTSLENMVHSVHHNMQVQWALCTQLVSVCMCIYIYILIYIYTYILCNKSHQLSVLESAGWEPRGPGITDMRQS